MAVNEANAFNNYVKKLEEVTNISVNTYSDYLADLKKPSRLFCFSWL